MCKIILKENFITNQVDLENSCKTKKVLQYKNMINITYR